MKGLRKRILGGVLLLAVIGLAFYVFSVRIDFLTTENAQDRLVEAAENNAKSMKMIFDKDIVVLTSMAKYWENGEDLTSEESLTYLKEMQTHTSFIRMGLDLPDGTSYTNDGHQVDVADMGYLEQVFDGQTFLTDLKDSRIEDAPSFAVVVPVYRDGQVIAGLRGVYKSAILMDTLKLRTFDGQGYFNLINNDGDFLIQSSEVQESHSDGNLFDVLKNVTFQDPFALEKLQKDIKNQKSDFTVYSLAGAKRCVYYTPVNTGQWYILSVVPTEYLTQQKTAIDSAAILLLLLLTLLFVILIGYIVWQGRRSQVLLRQERDYLEHVLNNIPLSVFITNHDRRLDFVNEAACRLFSCGQEVKGQKCDVFKLGICGTPQCAITKMEQSGDNCTYFEKGGKNYMVSMASLDGEKVLDGKYIEIIQDITEQVNIQRVLEEKTLELETMSENLAGGILITTLEEGFPVIRCNQGYLDLLGNTKLQVEGDLAIQWVAPEDRQEVTESTSKQLQDGDEVFLEHRLARSNGERLWVALRGKRAILHGKEVCIWLTTNISYKREAELELRISEERNRIAIQNTEDIIIDYDMVAHKMYHSSKAMEIYGVAEMVENMPQSMVDSGTVLKESTKEYFNLFRQIFAGTPKCSCVIRARAADGRILWNRMSFTTIFDNEGVPVRAIGMLQDVTREIEAENRYKREARYRELTGKDGAFYYEADITHHRFLSGHETIVQAYCKEPTDDFDTIINLLLDYMVYEQDRALVESKVSWDAVMNSYNSGKIRSSFEYRRSTVVGEPMWVECSLHFFRDEDNGTLRCLGGIKDINESKQRELSFKRKSERDLLTGLYNKVTTELLVKDYTNFALQNGLEGAFLLIDLDNFKKVNDTLGHSFGDAVLSEVSRKLLALFRKEDIVGRIGGDEFVAFMCQVGDEATVIAKARQICEMFHSAYTGIDNTYKISGTIGIARFPEDGDNFQELYNNADRALYYAKGRGKDTYALYAADLHDHENANSPARGIDNNSGKMFSENITEYVLKILYESADSHRAINAILELVSKHFGFSRGYIFEYKESNWSNTFEWWTSGTTPLTDQMREFVSDALLNNEVTFNENEIFVVNGLETQMQEPHSFLAKQGIVSLAWFATTDNGSVQTIIGFDNCSDKNVLGQEELSILKQVSMLMSTFLANGSS